MTEPERRIQDYYDLVPTKFATLHTLTISQGISSNGVCEQSVYVKLRKELADSNDCLHIEFYGVRNLNLQQPDWSLITIGHLEILDGKMIPSIESNYLVRDPEQERIVWFECKDFNAFIV